MSCGKLFPGMLFLLLIGCALTSTTTDTPSELMLQYRFPTDRHFSYDLSSSSKEVSEVMGQSIEVNTVSSTHFTILPKGLEDGNTKLQVTIDTSYLTINHPRGELKADMAGVIGRSFTMQLSPFGKEMNLAGNEAIEFTLGPVGKRNATSAFSSIFSDLSEKLVKIGDMWSTRDTIKEGSGGMNVLIVFDGMSRLDGMVAKDGYNCARIVSSFKGTIEGEGTQGPMQLSTKGTLDGIDTTFFAYKEGFLLHSASEVAMKTTTEASGPQNMTIPGTRTSKMTLSFKGEEGKK